MHTLNTRIIQLVSAVLALLGIISLVEILGGDKVATITNSLAFNQTHALLFTVLGVVGLLASFELVPVATNTWAMITGTVLAVFGCAGILSGADFSGFGLLGTVSTGESWLHLLLGAAALAASRGMFDRVAETA